MTPIYEFPIGPGDRRRRGRVDAAAARRGAVGDDAGAAASAAQQRVGAAADRGPAAARGRDRGRRGRARQGPHHARLAELPGRPDARSRHDHRQRAGQYRATSIAPGRARSSTRAARVWAGRARRRSAPKSPRPIGRSCAASGDGSWMFGNPQVVTWASKFHKAPVLFIISNNRGYSTGTTQVSAQLSRGLRREGPGRDRRLVRPVPELFGRGRRQRRVRREGDRPGRGRSGDPARARRPCARARRRCWTCGCRSTSRASFRCRPETGFWDASARRTATLLPEKQNCQSLRASQPRSPPLPRRRSQRIASPSASSSSDGLAAASSRARPGEAWPPSVGSVARFDQTTAAARGADLQAPGTHAGACTGRSGAQRGRLTSRRRGWRSQSSTSPGQAQAAQADFQRQQDGRRSAAGCAASGSGVVTGARSSAKARAGASEHVPAAGARRSAARRRVSAVTWRNSAGYDTGQAGFGGADRRPSRCSSTRTMYVPGPLSGKLPPYCPGPVAARSSSSGRAVGLRDVRLHLAVACRRRRPRRRRRGRSSASARTLERAAGPGPARSSSRPAR